MRMLISKFMPDQGTKATTEALHGTCANIARRRYWTCVLLIAKLASPRKQA